MEDGPSKKNTRQTSFISRFLWEDFRAREVISSGSVAVNLLLAPVSCKWSSLSPPPSSQVSFVKGKHETSFVSQSYKKPLCGKLSCLTGLVQRVLVSDGSYHCPLWPGGGGTFPYRDSTGGARHSFVYVLKPTSRARRESHLSTPIRHHRIPFYRDISHHSLTRELSLLCVLLIS